MGRTLLAVAKPPPSAAWVQWAMLAGLVLTCVVAVGSAASGASSLDVLLVTAPPSWTVSRPAPSSGSNSRHRYVAPSGTTYQALVLSYSGAGPEPYTGPSAGQMPGQPQTLDSVGASTGLTPLLLGKLCGLISVISAVSLLLWKAAVHQEDGTPIHDWQVCSLAVAPGAEDKIMAETAIKPGVKGVPGFYCSPTSDLGMKVLKAVPELSTWSKWYQVPTWGGNGHLHTILASKLRSTRRVEYHRVLLSTPGGGTLALDRLISVLPERSNSGHGAVDFVESPSEEWIAANRSKPFLLLTSGLGGGSQDPYVRSMAAAGAERGFQVAIINMRGCGNSPVTSPRFFSAYRGSTDDVRLALAHVRANFVPASAPVAVVGWSNGGTIVNNLLAEQGTTHKEPQYHVDAGASLACPLDMPIASANLRRWFHRSVYDRAIAKSLLRNFEPAKHLFEDGPVPTWNGGMTTIDVKELMQCTTIEGIDDAITKKIFGFPTVEAYYAHASSNQRLKDVRVPLILLNAIDDPIAPGNGISYDQVRANDNIVLGVTQHGGHLGWCDSGQPFYGPTWVENSALGFLRVALEL